MLDKTRRRAGAHRLGTFPLWVKLSIIAHYNEVSAMPGRRPTMTNDLNTPSGRPSQEELGRLAEHLEEHFNNSKDEPLALAIKQWDEKHAP